MTQNTENLFCKKRITRGFYFSVALGVMMCCLQQIKVCADSTMFPADIEVDEEPLKKEVTNKSTTSSPRPATDSRKVFVPLVSESSQKPQTLPVTKESPQVLQALPVAKESPQEPQVLPVAKRSPASDPKGQPLPIVTVEAHPKIEPLPEVEASVDHSTPAVESVSFSAVAQGRPPLAFLESHHDVESQQWYLLSSAKRGLKNSSDVIDIVAIQGGNNFSLKRGEEIKALLTQMGIKPENMRLISAKGEAGQEGQIYIFGEASANTI